MDTYIDVELLPFPDAKVAAALCIGGSCKYIIKDSSGVSNSWLLQYVVLNIYTEYARDIALALLAPPLCEQCLSLLTLQGYLPQSLTSRIKAAYYIIGPQQNSDNNKPVERRLIAVNGADEAQVYIDEVGTDEEATTDDVVLAAGRTRTTKTTGEEGGGQAQAAGHSQTRYVGCTPSRGTRHNMG